MAANIQTMANGELFPCVVAKYGDGTSLWGTSLWGSSLRGTARKLFYARPFMGSVGERRTRVHTRSAWLL